MNYWDNEGYLDLVSLHGILHEVLYCFIKKCVRAGQNKFISLWADAILVSPSMASYSGIEFSEVVDEILASDRELSGDEDLPDSVPNYQKDCGDSDSENSCPINFVCEDKAAIIRDEPCFRNNALEDELNEVSCALLFIS